MKFPTKSSLTLILLLALPGARLRAEVVTVHFQTVFEEYIELKMEDQKLREEVGAFQQEQQQKVQSLQEKQQAFNDLRNRAAQPDVAEADRKKMVEEATAQLEELNREEQELRQERTQFQRNLEEKGLRLRRAIVEKVNKQVAEMAEQQGWEVVLDSSAKTPNGLPVIPYTEKTMDRTDLVIRELNSRAIVAPAAAE
ncbi:MAG: OmpH family outer membrane protein [Kiritimatiellia bacterium]